MCIPTGGGKTVVFSYTISKAITKGKRCMILTHRTELLLQAGGIVSGLGCDAVNLDAKLKTIQESSLYVAMTQTLVRRLKNALYLELLQSIDLLIIDESHLQSFNSILPYLNEKTIVIGATATPIRTGNQTGLDDFYTDLIEEVRISDLIRDGYLAKPNYYGNRLDFSEVKRKANDYDTDSLGDFMNKHKLFNGVYENYTRLTPKKKAIIFAPNVESSKVLVSELKNKGLDIKHLDGNTQEVERKSILNWFKNTPNALLSNVGILTAGYDEPSIEVVILYRATKSLALYLQMVGRGSRVTSTKKEFTILDFGNNIYTHDFWHKDREWSLTKKPKSDGVAPVKNCVVCDAIIAAQSKFCEICGSEQPKTEKEKAEELRVELSKLTNSDIANFAKVKNFEKLDQIAEFRGYKKSWVAYRVEIEDLNEYAIYKGYNMNWVERIKNIRNGRQITI